MIKLELKHLAPYLPYGLEAINKDNKQMAIMGCLDKQTVVAVNNGCLKGYDLKYIKPILRPLSSMTKDESCELMNIVISDDKIKNISIKNEDSLVVVSSQKEHGLYVLLIDSKNRSIEAYYEDYSCITPNYPISYEIYEWLFSKHFDIFGLIKHGLAITKVKHKDYADINK